MYRTINLVRLRNLSSRSPRPLDSLPCKDSQCPKIGRIKRSSRLSPTTAQCSSANFAGSPSTRRHIGGRSPHCLRIGPRDLSSTSTGISVQFYWSPGSHVFVVTSRSTTIRASSRTLYWSGSIRTENSLPPSKLTLLLCLHHGFHRSMKYCSRLSLLQSRNTIDVERGNSAPHLTR